MNRAFFPVVKCLLVAALAFSPFTYAVEKAKAVAAKADSAKGDVLYTNGDPARNIKACIFCHGAAGASTITPYPKLGGQHAAYIHKQLINFRGPDRNNPIMSPIAKLLTDDEMQNIAAYLDAQAPKSGAAKDADTQKLGKKIYRAGIAEKSVPACAGCHGPNGAGIPNQFPRIGGQHQDYTAAELINFRTDVRKNAPMMTTISKPMSDDEIKAVADYIAGLK